MLERATITSPGSVLYVAEDFDMTPLDNSTTSPRTLEEVERDHILSVLDETNWRIEGSEGAARVLGINPSTLRTRMMKLRIHRPGQSQSKLGTKAAG